MNILNEYNPTTFIMSGNYYVEIKSRSDGFHDVHHENCKLLPPVSKRIHLGHHLNFSIALKEAGLYYSRVKECPNCGKNVE